MRLTIGHCALVKGHVAQTRAAAVQPMYKDKPCGRPRRNILTGILVDQNGADNGVGPDQTSNLGPPARFCSARFRVQTVVLPHGRIAFFGTATLAYGILAVDRTLFGTMRVYAMCRRGFRRGGHTARRANRGTGAVSVTAACDVECRIGRGLRTATHNNPLVAPKPGILLADRRPPCTRAGTCRNKQPSLR